MILHTIVALILSIGVSFGVDAEQRKIHIVLNQKEGPLENEWIIETTNVKVEVFTEILKDVNSQISWNWSRLMHIDSTYVLFGCIIGRDDSTIIGVAYYLTKVDGKWSMTSNQKKVILSR